MDSPSRAIYFVCAALLDDLNATCTMAMLLFLPLRLLPTDIEQN
jgi:hypothetical protein